MSNTRIRQAFEQVTATWAAALSPPLPIGWSNVSFVPPTTRHARAFLIPGKTEGDMLDGKHRQYTGLFQMSLYAPEGSGDAELRTLADSLDAVFPMSTPLVSGALKVFIIQPASHTQGLNESGWYGINVTVGYQADEVVS